GEVDVPQFAVGFAQIVESLADQVIVKGLAVFDREQGAQERGVADGLRVLEGDRLQLVSFAFLQRDGNVHHLAFATLDKVAVHVRIRIAKLGLWVVDYGLEVTMALHGIAHALRVFFQLGGVKSAREQVLKKNRVGNADGLQVLHGSTQRAAVYVLVAL